MSKIIETTVAGLPEALSHADVDGDRLVTVEVYTAEEEAEFARMRKLAQEGLDSLREHGPIEAKDVERRVLQRLIERYGYVPDR